MAGHKLIFVSKKKILVIEDEPEMRRNLVTILELEGYLVANAENGVKGIALAASEKPHLILCDVMMPDVDGHRVLIAIRDDPGLASTPFIFLTARGERLDVRSGMKLGADDYLVKPIGKSELLEAVAARLKRAELNSSPNFRPNFNSSRPLEAELGLTPRVAEVLLWVSQGKTNPEIATILGIAEATVKKHVLEIFQVLGVETRTSATLRALEVLSSPLAESDDFR